jgi:hypothetical protein
VPSSVKAVIKKIKNKKIKDHKNPDDSAATRHLSWLSSCLPGLEGKWPKKPFSGYFGHFF